MDTTTTGIAGDAAASQQFGLIRRVADDLAHELKNPLNAVVINLEVLRSRIRSGNAEGALERIDVIEGEVRRLHLLLDQMLRLVRPDHSGSDTFPADEVLGEVEGIAAVLAKLGRRGFELEPIGDAVYVQGTREELRFALLALVEAALQAAPEGDTVRLHGEEGERSIRFHVDAPSSSADALHEAAAALRQAIAGIGIEVADAAAAVGCRTSLTMPRGI